MAETITIKGRRIRDAREAIAWCVEPAVNPHHPGQTKFDWCFKRGIMRNIDPTTLIWKRSL